VFGCPVNRAYDEGADLEGAVTFFKEIGDYACQCGTVIGMEANPTIYNTNYINDTISALQLISEVSSKGFKLNLDTGTIITNGESLDVLIGNVRLINHVHISEPHLAPIERRELHGELSRLLRAEDYEGFVSVEMGSGQSIPEIENIMSYIEEIFL
jgi:sugar phosphate isomerase/epimerase